MIQFPQLTNRTSGLVFAQGRFRCYWYSHNARKQRSLGTTDMEKAIQARDAFYASLRAKGGTERENNKMVFPEPENDTKYIYERKQKPFFVRVGKDHLGEFDTREEAQAARNEHIKKLKE